MRSNKLLLGLIGGLASGALLGLLLAPHKGSKTRKMIYAKGKDYADDVKGKFGEFMEDVMDKYHNILGKDPDPIGKMPK
jgi:gas vesicle protein